MAKKYVYVVKSGTLSGTQYYFSMARYFTSKVGAKREIKNILHCNRAKDITNEAIWETINEIQKIKYVGEEGKYKAMVIMEKHELRTF
jgi:hypothetical protein